MNRFKKYSLTGILIILMCFLAFYGGPKAWGDTTQTNTSGSNTSIDGGYESTTTTTYESGSESTSTTTNTTNSDIKSSPPSASAPSYNAMTQDVCAVGASAGIQTFGVGISGGKHFIDKNCECKNNKRTYKTHKEWANDMSYENDGGLVIDDTGECESCQ